MYTPYYTIFVRFSVPPLFIVPTPREREHVPRDLYPLLDWQEGAVVTHGSSEAPRRRRTLTRTQPQARLCARPAARGASATSDERALSFVQSLGPRSAAGPGARRLAPPRSAWSGRTPRGTRAQARGTARATVPPSWQHADVPPSLKCTPLLRLYPLPWSRSAIGYIKTHKDGTHMSHEDCMTNK